jgi:uncharacterized sulfatase
MKVTHESPLPGMLQLPLILLCSAAPILARAEGVAAAPGTAAARPNILYIMADDHSAQAIGAYAGRLAPLDPTPTIDRLAKEGMRFTNCFCVNSICSPSRASILTGQYSQSNRVLWLDQPLPPERQYLPKLMHDAGYVTAIIGKWHLTDEPAAFDYYKTYPIQGTYFDPVFCEKGKGKYPDNKVATKGHEADVVTDSALDWLQHRDPSKPFFFCLHYKSPHDDFENAPRYNDYLKDVEIPEPDSLYHDRNHGSIATRGDHDELLRFLGSSVGRRNVFRNMLSFAKLKADSPRSDDELKHQAYQAYLKRYLRCVKGIDDNLRRLLAWMEQEGLMNNTLIVYTSDQGMWLGEHDYVDKRWMYEESLRMPLIVRYPGAIKAGATSDAIINTTDFAPTLLDYAGAETPSYMQGHSFRSILETGKTDAKWRTATYYRYWMHLAHHYNPAHFGIRTGRYALMFFYGILPDGKGIQTPPGWEFYDLQSDPEELDNRYDDPKYTSVIAELKTQLKQLRQQNGETDHNYPAVQAVVDKFWDTTPENRAAAVEISHAAARQFDELQKVPVR